MSPSTLCREVRDSSLLAERSVPEPALPPGTHNTQTAWRQRSSNTRMMQNREGGRGERGERGEREGEKEGEKEREKEREANTEERLTSGACAALCCLHSHLLTVLLGESDISPGFVLQTPTFLGSLAGMHYFSCLMCHCIS